MIKLLSTLLLLSIFAVPASAATIYKWKDKEGQIHYTRTPPPKSMTNDQVESHDSDKVPATRIEEAPEVKVMPHEQPAATAEMSIEAKRRHELCQSAQYGLNEMRRTDKVTEHGHPIEITEEERRRRLNKLQEQVREYCTPNNPQPVPETVTQPVPRTEPMPAQQPAPRTAPMPVQSIIDKASEQGNSNPPLQPNQ